VEWGVSKKESVMPDALFQNVDCLGVQVPDLDEALAFYSEKLGHPLLWRTSTSAGLRFAQGGSMPELVLHKETWRIATAIKVASVPEAVARFLESGGTLVEAPAEIPIGRLAVVADPWNNHLVLLDSSKGRLQTDSDGNVVGVSPGAVVLGATRTRDER
jgi:predicted enzyme related to lactoylglutathione lyase